MTTMTRREFGVLTLGAIALPRLAAAQTVGGVRLGVQTYSFRELPRTNGEAYPAIIRAMQACGLTECEVWATQLEPVAPWGDAGRPASPEQGRQHREVVRQWRLTTQMDHFRRIGEAFKKAGLTIYAYNYSFDDNFTDKEIEVGFAMARALGAEIITASTSLTAMKRVVPYAEQNRMIVAVHNHDDPKRYALVTPDNFAGLVALSRYFKINLDIGHFTAANFDALAYIREHHTDITNLHLKDRRRDLGPNTPWGTGDAPIREVLALLKREKWPIRAYVEYEYKGAAGPVDEVKKCLDYTKAALA